MNEQVVVGQRALQSIVWWVGLIACIVQGLCGVLVLYGVVTPDVTAAISVIFAGILAYCNGNNPNVRGQYGAGNYGLKL